MKTNAVVTSWGRGAERDGVRFSLMGVVGALHCAEEMRTRGSTYFRVLLFVVLGF